MGDIAPTAVRMAVKHRHPLPGYCLDECFKQGSAAAIPWPAKSFDAIMTTDVLEHIPETDVPTVAKEFARIVRQAVYAKIATKAEGNREPLNTLHANKKGGNFDKFHYLHETVHGLTWWRDMFLKHGNFSECRIEKVVIVCS